MGGGPNTRRGGSGGSPTSPAKPQDLLNGAPSIYRGMRLPNVMQDL